MIKGTKKVVGDLGKEALKYATVEQVLKLLKTETGKKTFGKPFNIGPDDEGVLDDAINELALHEKANMEELRIDFYSFLDELEKNDFSSEWLKAVLVSKNKKQKNGLSSAAITIGSILKKKKFKERVAVAGSQLIHKKILTKIKEGLHIVKDPNSKDLKILIKKQGIFEKFSKKAEEIKKEFKDYSWSFAKRFWLGFGVLIGLVAIIEFFK